MTSGAWSLSTKWPITLFPVRVETRFLVGELCIRVIPDTIHADTHEPELTDAELAAGQRYWAQVSGADAGTAAAAWSALAAPGHAACARALVATGGALRRGHQGRHQEPWTWETAMQKGGAFAPAIRTY